ncbi:hypothetical protein Tco_0058652 [Tanacetum coccineum]
MVKMAPYEAFACSCGAGDVVLRESLAKTLADVKKICGRRNESVYRLVLLDLQRLQFILQDPHRLQFILQDLQHFHAILQELQHLKAIHWELQKMQSAQTASTCLIR